MPRWEPWLEMAGAGVADSWAMPAMSVPMPRLEDGPGVDVEDVAVAVDAEGLPAEEDAVLEGLPEEEEQRRPPPGQTRTPGCQLWRPKRMRK